MKSKIIILAVKEYRHIIRDPRTLGIIFMLPIVMILLYGYAINLDVRNIPVAVVDYDRSPLSRMMVEKMVSSGYFSVTGQPQNISKARELIYSGRAFGTVVIPQGFMSDATKTQGTCVQLLLDGSDANTATIASNYFNLFVLGLENDLSTAAPFSVQVRILYNPDLESVKFIVPGLAAILMMLICALMTSATIAREKETGTMELVLTTPIKPHQMLIGKVLPYIIIAFLECLLIVGFAHLWFGVPVAGSLSVLMVMTLGYVFCALSIGITISAAVRTQQVAVSLAMVSTLMPSVMLSGFIFPVASMPWILRMISKAMPATYYLKIIRGIMLKGVGWSYLWPNFAVLVCIGAFFILIGMKKFSTRLT
ncbi:MAG TPA: ABC transporter permease [archaeon]|nr:ABC transporter permease [archaeon]